jgi:preprotein translocase subunit SecG
MLYTFLLTLLVIDCIVVIGAILLQSGKGGGLAASFGGASSSPDAFIGIRQAGNLLTKTSWWGGGIFLVLAFMLQMMSTRTTAPRSVLERGLGTQPVNAAPPTPAPTSAPAVPLEPVPANPAPSTTPAPATTPQR